MRPDFEAMYAADPDPWSVRTSWYERRKLAVLLAALPHERYRRAWEPGCGIGVGTAALAERIDHLVASDGSPRAVAATRDATAGLSHVRVVDSVLPEVPLDGLVDLVVAAEFLYYLDDLAAGIDALWDAVVNGRSALRAQGAADAGGQPGHGPGGQHQRPGDRFRRRRVRHAAACPLGRGRGAENLHRADQREPDRSQRQGRGRGRRCRPLEPGPGRLAVEGREADPAADTGRHGRAAGRDQRHRPDRGRPCFRRRRRGQPDVR